MSQKLERLRTRLMQFQSFETAPEVMEVREHWPIILQGSRSYIDFRSFDALGLWQHKALRNRIEKACFSAQKKPFGPKARRNSGGYSQELRVAEKQLAGFFRTQDAVLFASKSQAVLSALSALIEEGDRVFASEHCLAPLEDITFLLGAKLDIQGAAEVQVPGEIPSETVLAPDLDYREAISLLSGQEAGQILALKRMHTFSLVDESAALGVQGLRGSGRLELLSQTAIIPENISIISELSHYTLFPAAVLAGPELLCDFVRYFSKSLQIENTLHPEQAIAISETLDVISLQNKEREHLRIKLADFRRELSFFASLPIIPSESHIIAFRFSKAEKAQNFCHALSQRQLLADVFRTSSLRQEQYIVRFILSVMHTQEMLAKTLEALEQISKR